MASFAVRIQGLDEDLAFTGEYDEHDLGEVSPGFLEEVLAAALATPEPDADACVPAIHVDIEDTALTIHGFDGSLEVIGGPLDVPVEVTDAAEGVAMVARIAAGEPAVLPEDEDGGAASRADEAAEEAGAEAAAGEAAAGEAEAEPPAKKAAKKKVAKKAAKKAAKKRAKKKVVKKVASKAASKAASPKKAGAQRSAASGKGRGTEVPVPDDAGRPPPGILARLVVLACIGLFTKGTFVALEGTENLIQGRWVGEKSNYQKYAELKAEVERGHTMLLDAAARAIERGDASQARWVLEDLERAGRRLGGPRGAVLREKAEALKLRAMALDPEGGQSLDVDKIVWSLGSGGGR